MANDKDSIKKFVAEFLENLGCEYEEKEDGFNVSKVPKDFEDFVGKKLPYVLIFDKKDSMPDAEVMTKGSYMLKAMMNYLSEKGQTTLLKLDFDINPREIISKRFSFNNCEICSISKEVENIPFLRFTFITTFQYLNEKKQVMNDIFADEKGVIEFDMSRYRTVEGKKEDVKVKEVKTYYGFAKEKLKERIAKDIEKLGESLGKKLDKEIERIREHYRHARFEIEEIMKKSVESGKEIDNSEIEKLRKEEEFFINDETRKHSLNIDNKLMNTSIIYYPLYTFKTLLLSSGTRRQLDLSFNPLNSELQKVSCEKCGKEMSKISLCSFGHLSCRDCIGKCSSCGKDYCKTCLDKRCYICGKEICRKCSVRCSKCNRYVCVDHVKKSVLHGTSCMNCLKKCSSCQNFFTKESFIKCPSCGREMCGKCSTTGLIRDEGKVFCKGCVTVCKFCNKAYTSEKFKRCLNCKTETCNYPGKCINCRKQLCPKARARE